MLQLKYYVNGRLSWRPKDTKRDNPDLRLDTSEKSLKPMPTEKHQTSLLTYAVVLPECLWLCKLHCICLAIWWIFSKLILLKIFRSVPSPKPQHSPPPPHTPLPTCLLSCPYSKRNKRNRMMKWTLAHLLAQNDNYIALTPPSPPPPHTFVSHFPQPFHALDKYDVNWCISWRKMKMLFDICMDSEVRVAFVRGKTSGKCCWFFFPGKGKVRKYYVWSNQSNSVWTGQIRNLKINVSSNLKKNIYST